MKFKYFYLGLMGLSLNSLVFCQTNIQNPCYGDNELLSIIDRPSAGDSVCTVPNKKLLIESGYQYQNLRPLGNNQNLPEVEVRFGFLKDTEISVLLPNYNYNSIRPRAGYTSTSLGLKHQIFYNQKMMFTIENVITPPAGSTIFGNQGLGDTINAILNYNFTESLGLTFQFGVSTQTQSIAQGGARYNTVIPDLVLGWTKNNIVIYGEIYGQNQTGPHQPSGFNMDVGIIYLLTQKFSVDFSVGQRINGNLGGFENYIGAGVGLLFGN